MGKRGENGEIGGIRGRKRHQGKERKEGTPVSLYYCLQHHMSFHEGRSEKDSRMSSTLSCVVAVVVAGLRFLLVDSIDERVGHISI